MDLSCEVSNRSTIENQSEYNHYLATLRKKMIKVFHEKYTVININLDEFNKTINDYISIHIKNFDFCFLNCEFVIEVDNKFIAKIKTNYFHYTDISNINRHLLYDIVCFKSRGHKFYIINQTTINSISDRCNMSYELYMNQHLHVCERKKNINIAKYPHLINSLDRNKKHPFMRKFSHIKFNN